MRVWLLVVMLFGGCEHDKSPPVLDVPTLPTVAGTLPLDSDRIIEIKGELAEHIVTPSVVAVAPGRLAVPLIDGFAQRGISPGYVVRAGGQLRMVIVLPPHAVTSDETTVELHLGEHALDSGGVAVSLADLPRVVGTRHLALAIDRDVTLQRIVEVAAALGGKLAPVPVVRSPEPARPTP